MAARDPATDSARQAVLSLRDEVDRDLEKLEAAARSALDVRTRVARNPGKTAAAVGGAAFVAVGGPKRVLRRLRRAAFGPSADLPKSMLPEEIDKTLRRLGDDGTKVRGTIERDFAAYLEEKRKADKGIMGNPIVSGLVRPIGTRLAKSALERALRPDAQDYGAWLDQIRARVAGSPTEEAASGEGAATATPGGTPVAGASTPPRGSGKGSPSR